MERQLKRSLRMAFWPSSRLSEAGPVRGLHPSLDYKLASKEVGKATVTAKAGDMTYSISLTQPEKQGEGGVWVVSEITQK